MRRTTVHCLRVLWLAGLGIVLGCAPKGTRLEFTTFGRDNTSRQFYGEYTEAYYRQMGNGTIELLLRAEAPSSLDPKQSITQLIYLKTFWKPRPGVTAAEPSQINAHVQYAMLTPPTGVRYDGSAFLLGHKDRSSGEYVGRIESGTLIPRYRMGNAAEPFASAKFIGGFRATENPRKVLQGLHTLQNEFKERIDQP